MILGVVFGTLSSLFIAAPTAFIVMGRTIREADVAEEAKA
jgi:SecD/SecF fusion protein